jgi:hypothetical protein
MPPLRINHVHVFIVFLDAEQSGPDEFDPAVIVCRRPEGREKKAGAFADGVTTPDEGPSRATCPLRLNTIEHKGHSRT